jgi:type I restriction enzyme S subunit
MSELPGGWTWSTVGELAETSLGKMLDAKQQTGLHPTQYLRNINVRWGAFDLNDIAEMDIAPHELDRVLAMPGDVIACEGGEPGRAAVWRGKPIALQKALHRIRPAQGVSPDYLAYALQEQASTRQLDRLFTGTTIKHLPQEKLRVVPVALAPTAEQQRIVGAIEEAFSKLDAGEAGLRNVRQLLKRTRDAVLAAAVTGQLVPQDPADTPAAKILADLGIEPVEPAEGSRLPDGWTSVRTVDIAQVGSGTTPKRVRSEYWEDGHVPWVTSAAVNAGVVSEATEYVTERALSETSLRLWPAGTLLVAMYGEGQTRGRCAELAIEATCNQACAAIALRPELAGYKQTLRLHFDASYSANRQLAAGGVQPNLSGALIKEMVVALPAPEEAGRIVAEVERQMSFIEACERSVDAGLEVSAALRRSVLRAAFEGRLAPHDPTDEPASVLLDRIRAVRAAAQKPMKRRARATA